MTEKTRWQLWKESQAQVKPWDVLNPNNLVSAEIKNERYSICLSCPELIQATKQCKKCGCFMNQKTKLKEASCPLLKWKPILD
jgi:hypothetical protein